MRMLRFPFLAGALWLVAGCATLAPPGERPAVPLPAYDAPAADGAGAATLDWRSYFAHPGLQRLIDHALQRNADLRLAVLRVQEAHAAYGVQRSAAWPSVGLSVEAARARTAADLSPTGRGVTGNQFQVGLGVSSWEIDVWGRIASLEQAALEDFLATDAARRALTLSLVAQVADAWLGLQETEERLRLAEASAASQRESRRIFLRRVEVGAASRLDLTQVQTLLAQAEALVAQLRHQRAQQRHALAWLLGGEADGLLDTAAGSTPWEPPPLAPGLPSELLLQRPDLLAAEHRLRAANAQIGAARAAFFPSIRLTASGGVASTELDRLFAGASRSWAFLPSLVLPLFDAGRKRASLDLAEIRRDQAVVQYEQAVQTAFREVADALAARRGLAEQMQVQREALAVQQERARLSRLAYEHGAASFLDVLDAERSLIAAEQQLVQTRRALQGSHVALYRALGGGAQQLPGAPLRPSSARPAPGAAMPLP